MFLCGRVFVHQIESLNNGLASGRVSFSFLYPSRAHKKEKEETGARVVNKIHPLPRRAGVLEKFVAGGPT